jgi:hypothetical protein
MIINFGGKETVGDKVINCALFKLSVNSSQFALTDFLCYEVVFRLMIMGMTGEARLRMQNRNNGEYEES